MATDISSRVAWRLKKAIEGKSKKRQSGRGTATFVGTDEDGVSWVRLTGNDFDTPVKDMSVSVEPGDVISYDIRNGGVSVTGSTSTPSVGQREVEDAVAPVEREAGKAAELAEAAKAVADAIGQFFWHDSNGAHVSTEPGNATGPQNAVWNALGMLFRNGTNNLLALVTGNSPGMAIYDGQGNGDENIVASFVGNLIELGKNSTSAVIAFCKEKGVIFYDSTNDWLHILADGGINLEYFRDYYATTTVTQPATGSIVTDIIEAGTANDPDVIDAGLLMVADLNYDSQTIAPRHRAVVGTYSGWAATDGLQERMSRVLMQGELLNVKCLSAQTLIDMRRFIECLSLAKTAGDSFSVSGLRAGGYITNNKTEFAFTIPTPFRLYGVTGVTLTGSYTIRQNGNYLFGSTASAGYAFQGHYSIVGINQEAGQIHVVISTGATQTSATNNDTAAIVLNSCTITLS